MPAVRKTKIMELFWKIHPWIYEKSGGKIGGSAFGMPVLILMTKGRKSGLLRKNTLMYVTKGDACVVIASNAGEPNHPAWYHNLTANPKVQILQPRKLIESIDVLISHVFAEQ